MNKKKKTSKFGKLITKFEMKDDTTVEVYRNGNEMYFVNDGKIEKTIHVDDAGEVMGALLGMLTDGTTD